MSRGVELTNAPAADPAGQPGRVYLTFDDGPDPLWTPRILDVLARADAQATFFVVGQRAVRHAELVRRIVSEGHGLGNHTWSHRHPWTMSCAGARREIREGACALTDVSGQVPGWFRPPHGRLRRCMVDEAQALEQRVVLWSLSARDWGLWRSSRCIAARLRRVSEGAIVLMHDGRGSINCPAQTLAALPGFLEFLQHRGLRPARLDDAPGTAGPDRATPS